jgi:spore coat polysaccharide biosynthesis predicted glycosyltransferase SpsG
MRNKADAKIGLSKLEVAINFGGSLKVARHFNRLEHIFLAHEDVSFSIYCPLGLSQEVNAHFLEYQNVKVKEFTSNYLQELPRYDFLITSTGTSFLEGLFVDIPLIIFSLFPNASSNFERFQRERRILFSGTVHELENLDLTETIKRLYAMRDLRNSESKIESDLITIGQIELQAILLKILK